MLRTITIPLTIGALWLAVIWQPSAQAEISWPGWRGQHRDGWVGEFRPPARWPAEPARVWHVDVGTGYASPLVSNGRVYQHARDGDQTREGDNEVVTCLDLATGEIVWQQSYAVPFKMGGGGERHGKGPKSTPALADGRLFTLSIAGILTAWDISSGDKIWQRDYSERFEKNHLYWGASTSPLIDGDHVVVHFGTDGEGALIALDAASGEEIWSTGNDGPSYASPILVDIHGTRQIVALNETSLVGVESKTGKLLWEFHYPQSRSDQNMVTPAFYQNMVLLGGENRGIRALEPVPENGSWSLRERWFQKDVALDMSSAVMNEHHLFGFSHYGQGRLFCLDAINGEVLWQGPRRTGENVTFLSTPDHIVALVDDGKLDVVRASRDQYQPVASYRVAERSTWSPPVLLADGILVKDHQTLTRWSFSTESSD